MEFDGGLRLEREGHAVILRAKAGFGGLGAVVAGFSFFVLMSWINQAGSSSGYVPGILIIAVVMGAGTFFAVPREVVTSFDPRKRQVRQDLIVANGWYRRRRSYAYAEIEGLGVKEYGDDGPSHMPVMKLRTGKIKWLRTTNGDPDTYTKAIEALCAAANLPKISI